MMLKLSAKEFNKVRQWIYRNARHLELTLWQYEFENGSQEAVLNALSCYENEDGGFGNGMEPDSWNPDSTPYTTIFAVSILKTIGFTDVHHPMISGILRFFDSGAYFSENGWEWSIPTNNNYPHAPWWNFEQADATTEFGLSAEIVSFILSVCEKDSPLYNKAVSVAKKIIERLRGSIECDAAGGNVHGTCMLVETLQNLNLLERLDAQFLPEAAKKMVANAIVTDSSQWEKYGGRPLEYIETPTSIYYSDYKDIVGEELNYLIETRPKQAVWGITWTWFDNTEKYAEAFAISENWWKSNHAISKMRYLKNFNRLETAYFKDTPSTMIPLFQFDKQCEEAIELYKKAFGAKVNIFMRFSDANPQDWPSNEEDKNLVYHAQMTIGRQRIILCDNLFNSLPRGHSVYPVMTFKTVDEVKAAYNVLADGATIISPMSNTTYSDCIVSFVDKFGIFWDLMVE